MKSRDNEERRTETPTSLYLVRIWKRRSGEGALSLHGRLQHVVSGESCHFDGLSGLPDALEQMLRQEADSYGALGPEVQGPAEGAE